MRPAPLQSLEDQFVLIVAVVPVLVTVVSNVAVVVACVRNNYVCVEDFVDGSYSRIVPQDGGLNNLFLSRTSVCNLFTV